MWFRLAKELGMSVRRCQQEVSSREFAEWVAFYALEPFGDRIQDIRMGTLASVQANTNLSKGATPFKPMDFVPWADVPEPLRAAAPPEAVAASVFGIDLAALRAQGGKTHVIKNPRG
jgi:hypothetical protein